MRSPIAPFYELRDSLKRVYAKHTRIIIMLLKFVTAFLMLFCIQRMTGYMAMLGSLPVLLVLALVCSVLPWGFISSLMCLLLILQYTRLSLIVAAFALILIFIMILLDTIFAPGCGRILFLVPLAFFFKIPFVVPLILGMTAPVVSVIPMAFGVILYFLMSFVNSFAGVLINAEDVTMADTAMQLAKGMLENRFMFMITLAMIATTLVVYVIHRMSVDHAWTIAIFIGTVMDAVLILVSGLSLSGGSSMSMGFIVLGSIISGLIAFCVRFMIFAVDYKQTEYTQFEDDEYYYYVKAVPKVRVAGKDYDKIDIAAKGASDSEKDAELE